MDRELVAAIIAACFTRAEIRRAMARISPREHTFTNARLFGILLDAELGDYKDTVLERLKSL